MKIEIGMEIVDCDPRKSGRRGRVVHLWTRGFLLEESIEMANVEWGPRGGVTSVRCNRIHNKGIKSGYRVVSAPLVSP